MQQDHPVVTALNNRMNFSARHLQRYASPFPIDSILARLSRDVSHAAHMTVSLHFHEYEPLLAHRFSGQMLLLMLHQQNHGFQKSKSSLKFFPSPKFGCCIKLKELSKFDTDTPAGEFAHGQSHMRNRLCFILISASVPVKHL